MRYNKKRRDVRRQRTTRLSGFVDMLGVSVGHAYKFIRKLNQELEKDGFLVIAGKVPRRYFEKRWYGYSA